MVRLDLTSSNGISSDELAKPSFLASLKKPFWILLLSMAGVCILCIILFPKLINYFNLYFLSDDAFNIRRTKMINSTPGEVYYPYKILVELLLTIGPTLAAIWILRLHLSELKKVLLMIELMFLIFIITTVEQASSLKVIVVLFFIMLFYLPRYTKRFMIIGVAGGLFVVVFGLITQMSIKNPSRLSAVFQSYFSGPSNFAMGLTVASKSGNFFAADFLKGLLLVSTLFKSMMTSSDMFNKISDYKSIGREIMPFIAASANYLGLVLAPLPSVIIVLFTLKIDELLKKSETVLGKFIFGYAALSLALMLVMYTEQIFYSQLIVIILPLFVMLYCSRGKRFREWFKHGTTY